MLSNGKNIDRLNIFFRICVLCLVVLFMRLCYMQLLRGDYYCRQADGNRLRQIKLVAPRGLIYDANGKELVSNAPGFTVALQRQNAYPEELLKKLSTILEVPLAQIRTRIKEHQYYYEPIVLKNNISPRVLARFEEEKRNLRGALLLVQPERRYVYDELGVHALGYVGEVSAYEMSRQMYPNATVGSIVGKSGLERYYDSVLRGVDGFTVDEVDVTGSVVQNYDTIQPEPGKSLHLTLDYNLQTRIEEFTNKHLQYLRRTGRAPNAYAAAVVAIDPRSGAVKAMLSTPGYNPNLLVRGISEKDWREINDSPYFPQLNRAIAGEYPPGSTFKIVTGSAAFELGKVQVDEKILDRGYHPMVPSMRNAEGEILGWLNFIQGLSMSDNVYFYELGYRAGIDAIAKYAEIYGFGALTGIDLPEETSGLVASKNVKKKMWNEEWQLGDTFNAAIGQGFNLSTPLQLAVMLSSVANGGIHLQPYLVSKITYADGSIYRVHKPDNRKHIDVSQRTLSYMQEGMSATTRQGGTAAYFRTLPKAIAGKTGTAENSHGREHGLFAAYGPVESPELCVVCIVEQGGYGAVSAGPIVYQVFEEYFRERGWLPGQ